MSGTLKPINFLPRGQFSGTVSPNPELVCDMEAWGFDTSMHEEIAKKVSTQEEVDAEAATNAAAEAAFQACKLAGIIPLNTPIVTDGVAAKVLEH